MTYCEVFFTRCRSGLWIPPPSSRSTSTATAGGRGIAKTKLDLFPKIGGWLKSTRFD